MHSQTKENHTIAHKNKVMRSLNSEDGSLCVDLFLRPDGTFGYEEFRRDVEDGRGWFPIGFFGEKIFSRREDAWREAITTISWLPDRLAEDGL